MAQYEESPMAAVASQGSTSAKWAPCASPISTQKSPILPTNEGEDITHPSVLLLNATVNSIAEVSPLLTVEAPSQIVASTGFMTPVTKVQVRS